MVKGIILKIFILLIYLQNLESSTHVEAFVEEQSQIQTPLEGVITITHNSQDLIDPYSFKMDQKQLEANFIRHTAITGDTNISIYHFQLPEAPKGLYVLPSISVKIGDKTYQTIPSTYEVKKKKQSVFRGRSDKNSSLATTIIFHMEAGIKGEKILYPGQRATLFYRIFYNHNVDLSKSILPLVHSSHFKKVGDMHIYDGQEEELMVQTIEQEIEAFETGKFSLGPSLIEGYMYEMEGTQKVYDKTLLTAEAPAIEVEVRLFPTGQPASFNGAVGKIHIETRLLSPSTVKLGEKVTIEARIKGIENMADFTLPPLFCQPGFSGFFQLSQLPSLADIEKDVKIFQIELQPLSILVTEIPSIEVASFNSSTGAYLKAKSLPLSLHVEDFFHEKKETKNGEEFPFFSFLAFSLNTSLPIAPIQMKNSLLTLQSLSSQPIQFVNIVWMIFSSVLLLFAQRRLKIRWQKNHTNILQSTYFFQEAQKARTSLEQARLLETALWCSLWENKIVPKNSREIGELLSKNHTNIRAIFLHLQAVQYSENKDFLFAEMKEQVGRILHLPSQ